MSTTGVIYNPHDPTPYADGGVLAQGRALRAPDSPFRERRSFGWACGSEAAVARGIARYAPSAIADEAVVKDGRMASPRSRKRSLRVARVTIFVRNRCCFETVDIAVPGIDRRCYCVFVSSLVTIDTKTFLSGYDVGKWNRILRALSMTLAPILRKRFCIVLN